jgi:site-specific DNA-methyltransferase (adenine-specific)
MDRIPSLFSILSIESKNLTKIAKNIGISPKSLTFYNDTNKLPMGQDLQKICKYLGKTPFWLMIKLGIVDRNLLFSLSQNADNISDILSLKSEKFDGNIVKQFFPKFKTPRGMLYQNDCLEVLSHIDDNSIDLIFADPPFNLNKLYPSQINDQLREEEYLIWQEKWLAECIRVLKFGGSLYIWNLPKWNTYNSYFLNSRLKFRHWISVDIKYSLPIQGKFYPSHYSLLYYIKGDKPNTFHPDRVPMEICPNCQTDLRDYGGYKDKMNPDGVNLTDIWYDIPPVRHAKYKRRKGANELSIKLLDRIIECSSNEGDLIFDPFGGSGTTYIVAEMKNRRWIGSEIGPLDDIINRFNIIDEEKNNLENIRKNLNCLFTRKSLRIRVERGLWTPETVRNKKEVISFPLFNL